MTRRTALCLPLALLFLASVNPSKAQSEAPAPAPASSPPPAAPDAAPAAADGDVADVLYDLRANITLLCSLPNENSLGYVWKKNESSVEQAPDLKGRYVLERGGAEFHVKHSVENDFGNYSCALAGRDAEQRWAVRGRPHLKLPANSNVVEGQKLKLVCKVTGKPYPRVSWLYSNSTDEAANFTEAVAALAGRATLAASEQGVPDGALLVSAAARADAGRYRCATPAAAAAADTVLRVKDMYAALWPFLGICAEVFVLCAIILLYEKRRTKPDLDDSDTDNHDQKKS